MRPWSRIARGASILVVLSFTAAACDDPTFYGECEPGTRDTIACGLNGNGTKLRFCTADGRWAAGAYCNDPDECENGSARIAACEATDLGQEAQVCIDGEWEGTCESISLDGGGLHTCAARVDGTVVCWGMNRYRQLGNGYDPPALLEPSPVEAWDAELERVVAVRGGQFHTCAVREVGDDERRVLCFGDNRYGQAGNGVADSHLVALPSYVRGLTDVVDLDAGLFHTCAVRGAGDVRCWGLNDYGSLGSGEASEVEPEPVVVAGLTDAVAVSAGYYHSCAVRSTGEVACWGLNEDGQLGNGASGEGLYEASPVGVIGLVDVVSVAAGNFHTCALRATGEVACWGAGRLGELGSPGATGAVEPLPITGLADVVEISAGYTHTCVRRAAGEVLCWGLNRYGQLGFESEEEIVREPTPAAGVTDAIAVSAGGQHTCAMRPSGQVLCWGRGDHGQLGDGRAESSTAPVAIAGL